MRIDEIGTEAAAAAGIAVEVTGATITPPPTFGADNPFLFLIRDRETGAVLILGRSADRTRHGARERPPLSARIGNSPNASYTTFWYLWGDGFELHDGVRKLSV